MRIGSLFSGIGGLELGLERSISGAFTAWQVEQDPYARAVLAKHWPEVKRYENVEEVGSGNLERVELICGGFPCQDISVAGKGVGIEGARSGLWAEYARIIRELRPRYVVVENVPALITRGLGRVLGDLAESGYDATWDCIPAEAVGAHHRRDRLFVIAWSTADADGLEVRDGTERKEGRRYDVQGDWNAEPRDDGNARTMACEACGELWCERCRSHYALCGCPGGTNADVIDCVAEPYVADADGQRQLQSCELREQKWRRSLDRSGSWPLEPRVGRVAHGVSRRVDRLRTLGNAVVPQCAEVIGRVIEDMERGR